MFPLAGCQKNAKVSVAPETQAQSQGFTSMKAALDYYSQQPGKIVKAGSRDYQFGYTQDEINYIEAYAYIDDDGMATEMYQLHEGDVISTAPSYTGNRPPIKWTGYVYKCDHSSTGEHSPCYGGGINCGVQYYTGNIHQDFCFWH